MRKKKKRQNSPKPQKEDLLEYNIQATPFILRDLGWKFLKAVAVAAYPKFVDSDFRPLVFGPNGTTVVDALGADVPIKCFFAALNEFTDSPSKRMLMIAPYLDSEGVKILYFKWVDETYYDSFSVPDGPNRVWDKDNKENK